MRSSIKKTFSLAALVVALVAAGSLAPYVYRHRLAGPPEATVAAGSGSTAAGAGAGEGTAATVASGGPANLCR